MAAERYPLGTILEQREKPHERVRVAGSLYVKARKHLVLSTVTASGQEREPDYFLPEKEVDTLYDVVDLGRVPPSRPPQH